MFERLLELFFHAKSGVIAGVFLVGTTGALVTATAQNGVTTITITEASPSPAASTVLLTTTTTAPTTTTGSASPKDEEKDEDKNSSSTSSTRASLSAECVAQVSAAKDAVKTVDTARTQFHTDLEHMRKDLRGEAARASLEKADKTIEQLRESAAKEIHATVVSCKDDDEDNDQDEDKDEDNDTHGQGDRHNDNFVLSFLMRFLGSRTNVTTVTSSATSNVTTLSGTDPKAIADKAVSAMKLVFDTAKANAPKLVSTPKPTPTFRADRALRTPEPRRDGTRDGHEGRH